MGEVLIVAVSLYAFAMVSDRLSMSPVTAPMVFTTTGLIVGTGGLGWFDLDLEAESVSVLVEATLVLVLFTDAIRIDLRALRHQASFPARLLAIGLPLTIAFGTVAAVLLFDELTWPEAALLAAVLAPTDAALGHAVVSNQRLPVRIRQGLNAESGLNDGIMVPVVTVLLAIAAAETQSSGYDVWGELIIRQVGFGLLSGVVIGLARGWILHRRAVANRVVPVGSVDDRVRASAHALVRRSHGSSGSLRTPVGRSSPPQATRPRSNGTWCRTEPPRRRHGRHRCRSSNAESGCGVGLLLWSRAGRRLRVSSCERSRAWRS